VDAFNGRTGAVTLLDADMPARLSETSLNATIGTEVSTVGKAARTALDGIFAGKRSNGRYDPTGKPNGAITALDTGETVLNFGSAPLTVSSGVITHTPFAGAGSAGYAQVTKTDPIERIGCEARWQPGATIEQLAFVLPVNPWGGNPIVGEPAGVHFVISGNGQWHCSYWTGSGEQSPYYGEGRCADVRDGLWHPMSIEITDRAAGKAVINLPDGSVAPVQSPFITSATANHAVWEIYETNGTGITTPANFRKLWVNDAAQILDQVVATSGQAVQAVAGMKRVVTEFTASGSGTVPASAVGAYVTLIGAGGGGGSGRRGAAGTVRTGGAAGGSGGIINEQFIPKAALGTSYSVTLSVPGAGGAAVTANDTNGNAGTAASLTQFASGSMALRVIGGGGGGGGSTTAATAAGAGAPLAILGPASSATGGAGTNGSLMTTGTTGQAGSGGGITSADVAGAGGSGSSAYLWGNSTGGAGGVVDGAAPGSPALGIARPGDAPGGGAASTTTAAQAGANALGYGCGGGGGGASLNGNNSGKGGDGGPSYARVTFVTL
jgi:hypothetical protein